MLIALIFILGIAASVGIAYYYLKIINEPLNVVLDSILEKSKARFIHLLLTIIVYLSCFGQALSRSRYNLDILRPTNFGDAFWAFIEITKNSFSTIIVYSVILIIGLLSSVLLLPKPKTN